MSDTLLLRSLLKLLLEKYSNRTTHRIAKTVQHHMIFTSLLCPKPMQHTCKNFQRDSESIQLPLLEPNTLDQMAINQH